MPQPVFIIDDDEAMRASLAELLTLCGHEVISLAGPDHFPIGAPDELTGCIIIDVRMPGLDGLAFHRQIVERGIELPVIFISGRADVPTSVRAMRQGAMTFLTKPFREQELLDAVKEALEQERSLRNERSERRRLREALAQLDDRERVVMADVADGQQNKIIAARLGLSEISVKVIRGRIMRKLGITSVAHLARIAERTLRGR